jgi:integrase/recombinase XerD
MLTIYRRHLKRCEHRTEGRGYRRCRCPLHVEGLLDARMLRCSLDTCDWERAHEMVLKWEAEGRGPLPAAIVREGPMTIARACEQFISDAKARGLKRDTVSKYRLLFRHLQEFARTFRIERPEDLKFAEMVNFRASWKDSNLAAVKKLERLRSFFRFMQNSGWVAENVAEKLKNPKVVMRPTLPFTQDEMTKILTAVAARESKVQAQGKDNARRLRGLILLLRYSGLRIGDAASCSVDRLVDGKLRLYTQKTGQHVHCPLPEFVVRELDSVPRTSERYWFWSGYGEVKRVASKWQSLIHDVCEAAEIPGGHAHRFRDTFAVDLLLSGVPLERVAIALGHSSVRITEKHYSPWVRERQEQMEADLRRSWSRDPLVIMENAAFASSETNHTQFTRGKGEPVM